MWNEKRYNEMKLQCQTDIAKKTKTPYDYMMEYKEMIRKEDYEAAKAITEVLEPLKYHTADTHNHIPSLNVSNKKRCPSNGS
jgi:hypothetical protein